MSIARRALSTWFYIDLSKRKKEMSIWQQYKVLVDGLLILPTFVFVLMKSWEAVAAIMIMRFVLLLPLLLPLDRDVDQD